MEGIYKQWINRYSHGKRKKTATTKLPKKVTFNKSMPSF